MSISRTHRSPVPPEFDPRILELVALGGLLIFEAWAEGNEDFAQAASPQEPRMFGGLAGKSPMVVKGLPTRTPQSQTG